MLAFSMLSSVQAQSDEVRIYVFGPTIVATNSVTTFNVNVVGGPATDGGNYSIRAYLQGANLTGALPIQSSPFQDESEFGNFTVNVTAPRVAQKMTLVIEATSILDTTRVQNNLTYEIQVVEPIIINAQIENTGGIDLTDVDVKIYVDGNLIGNKTIAYLGAQNRTTITHEWLATSVASGRHEIMITVDMNGDGVIDQQQGDLVIYKYFYKEYGEIHPAIIITVAVLMVIVVLILIRTVMKKRRGW
jgi:hypothetical protein